MENPEREKVANKTELICADCGLPVAGSTPRTDVTRYLSDISRCQCSRSELAQAQETADGKPSATRITASFTVAEAQEILGARYEVLEFLGQGGMGSVFKVKDTTLDSVFAVKLLNPVLLKNEDSVRRFEHEARASMQLSSPHVAAVYAYGIGAGDTPYLVMDYLGGETLDQIISARKRLESSEIVDLFIQICEGLQAVHLKGVVHRDIKPGNIMVTEPKTGVTLAKIFDFGIAKALPDQAIDLTGDMTRTGEIFGSPLYMAPEQIRDNHADVRSDIHAIGCTMYKALTGIHPFEGKNILDTAAKILTVEAPSLKIACPEAGVSDSLDFVVRRCLGKDPRSRYATAKDLCADLERVRAGESLASEQNSAQKAKPSNVVGYAAAALIVLVLISCVAVKTLATFRSGENSPAQVGAGTSSPYEDAERLDALAYKYYSSGDYERAIPLMEFGLKTYRENGTRSVGGGREDSYLAENLSHIGKCYLKLHKYSEAQQKYRESLKLFTRWGNYRGGMMTEAVNDYAEVLRGLGQDGAADAMLADYKDNNNLTTVP